MRWWTEPRRAAAQSAAFFALLWVCLWQWVDVSLIYHGGGEIVDFPVFFWGASFFWEMLPYPGGVGRSVAALLAQSLHTSWLGAGVLAAQAWLIGRAGAAGLEAMNCPGVKWVRFAPAVVLLALHGRYAHFSEAITALAFGLGAAWLWWRLGAVGKWGRLVVLVALSAALYGAAGAALVVFSVLVALVSAGRREGWPAVLTPLALAGAVPGLAGLFLFGLSPLEAYAALIPVSGERVGFKAGWVPLLVATYALVPVVTGAVVLWRALARRHGSTAPADSAVGGCPLGKGRSASPQTSHGPSAPRRRRAWAQIPWPIETAGLALVAVGALHLAHDRRLAAVLAVDRCVQEQRWGDVPQAARGHEADRYVAAALAQAAFHTGQLTRRLPPVQKPGDLLLHDQTRRGHWNKAAFYWDLGYVNQALHHLAEAQEFCGPRPAILRRMALIHIALTNLPTARIYLNALTRVPFHATWARAYLARLDADPLLVADAEVSRLRRFMLRKDSVQLVWSPQEVLTLLLEANAQNRMAFEYLMTCHLLTKDLNSFARDLQRWVGATGGALGPLWEEALVLAAHQPDAPPALRQHPVSPAVHQRLAHVLQVLQECGGDEQAAARRLEPDHGQSYFYYYLFHP